MPAPPDARTFLTELATIIRDHNAKHGTTYDYRAHYDRVTGNVLRCPSNAPGPCYTLTQDELVVRDCFRA